MVAQELDVMGYRHVMVQRSWNELSEDAVPASRSIRLSQRLQACHGAEELK